MHEHEHTGRDDARWPSGTTGDASVSGLSCALVVVSGSKGRHAVDRAAQLRWAPHSRVELLSETDFRGNDWRMHRASSRLSSALRGVRGRLEHRRLARDARLEVAISREASTEMADVVLVPGGRRKLRERLFGAVPERIIRSNLVPVLVTQLGTREPYRRVLFATDFSECSRAALELALRLLPRRLEAFTVMHAYDTSYAMVMRLSGLPRGRLERFYEEARVEAEARMEAFLAPYRALLPDTRGVLLVQGDPRAKVRKLAAQLESDLLVVGRSGTSGLGFALLGGVAESSMRVARCDVLVVPAREVLLH